MTLLIIAIILLIFPVAFYMALCLILFILRDDDKIFDEDEDENNWED